MAKLTRYTLIGVIGMLMCIAIPDDLKAQNTFRLVIHIVDKDSLFLSQVLVLKTAFLSRLQCEKYVDRLPAVLQAKGYISSSVDSISISETHADVFLFVGEQYKDINLKIRNSDKRYLEENGWDVDVKNNLIPFSDYQLLSNKLLDYFEDHGYPFAKISLDSIFINTGEIIGVLNIEKGFPYHIDSIRTFGPAKISKDFIHRYLSIERGSLYSREKLDKVNQRLLELPYLQQSQPWDLTMFNTGALLNLYLQQKKSNQVNVLAGFLPANQQLGGKLLFTIDANLKLNNAFGGGENFSLIWQQLQPKSPKLHLQFTQPYLFKSPFSVDFLFELIKRDSSFLNINGQIGFLYMLSPLKTAKVVLQTLQTNVLQLDTLQIKASKKLPDIADVNSLNIGFNYDFSNTDYRFNPRKGSVLSLFVSAGSKTIKKNSLVTQMSDTSFDYNKLYDSIPLNTYQVRLLLKAERYFKLSRQTVLRTTIDGGWYQSPQYFRNELFQIGGYRLLRGFDEESIYTNQYAVASLEYRYLVGLNSNFFVFSDFGYSNNKIIQQSNSYLGLGAGLSFETKSGIFNVSYAVGKRNDLQFDIRQSKIHFGYVSIF